MQTKHQLSWSTSELRVRLVPWNWFKPTSNFLLTGPRQHFLWIFFISCLSLPYSLVCVIRLVVTCWERADCLALLYVMFSCVFVIFPYHILDQVWYLIVLIPDLCLPYFYKYYFNHKSWFYRHIIIMLKTNTDFKAIWWILILWSSYSPDVYVL